MTIKDSGTRRGFKSGAVRDMAHGKGRFDLLPYDALWVLAKHFEEGGLKYDDRNWEKGMPIYVFVDSAIRHLAKFLCGFRDEPHLTAGGWNILCAIATYIRVKTGVLPKKLLDTPKTYKGVDPEAILKLYDEGI